MTESDKPERDRADRNARLILAGLLLLAVITIGATIVSTMGEWNAPPPAPDDTAPAAESDAPSPAETL